MGSATNIHPKVVGAVLGGAPAGGLSVLVIWLLGLAHVQVDPVVAGILAAYLSLGAAWFGGWLAPILKTETPPK